MDAWKKDLQYLIRATAARPPKASVVIAAAREAAAKHGKNARERGEIQRAFIAAHAADPGYRHSYEKWRATQTSRGRVRDI